jgi:hypothetical protein
MTMIKSILCVVVKYEGKVAQRATPQIKKCVLELGGSDPIYLRYGMQHIKGGTCTKPIELGFVMTSNPIKKGITTTYNGTATISFRPGFLLPVPFVINVPVSIKLMGPSAMSVWIDPIKTREHFGNTPIYGVQQGMPMMQMISMK